MDNVSFGVGLVVGVIAGIIVGILIKEIIGNKLISITRDDSGRITDVLEMYT